MTTFIQLHLLTAYPPSNLNRDDTGSPKTAQFGGVTRLRVSSQSLKRAWRTAWKETDAFQSRIGGNMGERTQRMGRVIREHLLANGSDQEAAEKIARQLAGLFGKIKPEKDVNSVDIEQLAFVSPEEHTAALDLADRMAKGEGPSDPAADMIFRETDSAIDIAMFGRMLAADPVFNRDAAVQVAHAITTNRVTVEDDYYTAVDDLKTKTEDAGAGFIGEAGFGSGVFYLYLCIDRDLLMRNLGGAESLAQTAIAVLVEAAATVAPRGKQASFASNARASYVMVEKGTSAPRTLATAFLKPIRNDDEDMGLIEGSIFALQTTRNNFEKAYGDATEFKAMNAHAPDGTSLSDLVAFAVAR